jgi:hypothetical protein
MLVKFDFYKLTFGFLIGKSYRKPKIVVKFASSS